MRIHLLYRILWLLLILRILFLFIYFNSDSIWWLFFILFGFEKEKLLPFIRFFFLLKFIVNYISFHLSILFKTVKKINRIFYK